MQQLHSNKLTTSLEILHELSDLKVGLMNLQVFVDLIDTIASNQRWMQYIVYCTFLKWPS
jgi:hypothetical protein